MKNLKSQFKLIIYFLLFLNISNIILAKNSDELFDSNNFSNYLSGILSIQDSQYEKSYKHLKSLNNLEDNHYNYSQYYQYSLIALNKLKDAANYSKKLEDKGLDSFESNLISLVYHLKKKDFKSASIYSQRIVNKNQPGAIQNLLSTSLSSWVNFEDTTNLKSAIDMLDAIPKQFKNIKDIQITFAHCYFDSIKTEEMFKMLTSSSNIDYSRYNFFHANYLISKNNEKETKKILSYSLKQYPRSLILNQLKIDLEQGKKFHNKFDCKNSANVIAEIFYIASNALASQNNYTASNFYLSLAKYLNPNFVSFDVLHAENFFFFQEYEKANKIFKEIEKKGSIYNWYAAKKISSILIKLDKKAKALKNIENAYIKIVEPTVYEKFEYAQFLKNNEKYKKSIKYYSQVLSVIDSQHILYSQVLDGRGTAYERTEQWDKGEVDLLNSLSASPDNAYVINYLAYSWIEKGINIQKSLMMLRKANRLKPNDGYIIDSLGWALFKLKNYKEAKKYLEIAVSRMASDPVINDHYADSLWMNKKSLQARYYWNYVLKLEKTEEKLKREIEQKLLFGLKS